MKTYTCPGTSFQATIFDSEEEDTGRYWRSFGTFSSASKIRERVEKSLEKIQEGKRPPKNRQRAYPRISRTIQHSRYVANVGREPRTIYDVVIERGGTPEEAQEAMRQWGSR